MQAARNCGTAAAGSIAEEGEVVGQGELQVLIWFEGSFLFLFQACGRQSNAIAALPICLLFPMLSTHQTRPSTPCACTTTFIFASTQLDQLRKKTHKFARIPHLFSRRHADQETQSSPAKEYMLPPTLSPTFFPRFLFLFFFLPIFEAQIHIIHSNAIDLPVVLCSPQLASMLGCWAATKDIKSIGACR